MRDVLQFLADLPLYQIEQPYELYGFPDKESQKRTNCKFESKSVEVIDIRGLETNEKPKLLHQGFQLLRHVSRCPLQAKHFETVGGDKSVQMAYLEETIALVQEELNASKVVCFDWRFRRFNPRTEDRIPPRATENIRNFALPTGDVVHCDYSIQGGHDRIALQLLPEEISQARNAGQNIMILNIWRPLNDEVMNTPLLLCDRQSVQRKDLIEVDKVLPDKVEKSYFLHYRDYHRWHSLRNQRSDEVAMFITWRSDLPGQKFAAYSPHGAGGSQEDNWADPRESVEVRLIVFLNSGH